MKCITLFIISFLLLVNCGCAREGKSVTSPEDQQKMEICNSIANHVTGLFTKKMQKEKELRAIGFGGAGGGYPGSGLRMLSVDFECYQEMNISQARKLLLECVDGFLAEINRTPELKPFLREFPFTFRNVDISIIFISEKSRNFIHSPSIASARIDDELLMFMIYPEDKLKILKKETYEEALKIVEQESKSPDA